MTRPKILITGGTGFVGAKIVEALLSRHPDEYELAIADVHFPPAWKPPRRDIPTIRADVTNPTECVSVVTEIRPAVVVHTAGVVPHGQSRYTPTREARDRLFRVNVEGTRNMLKAAEEGGVGAFVLTSSCCVVADDIGHDYPNMDEEVPTGRVALHYGQSKVRYLNRLIIDLGSFPKLSRTHSLRCCHFRK